MDAKTRARLQVRAKIMKAMAHPARLLIVEELAQGERSVGELTEIVGADVSTVSKHLALLRNAGIVSDDKRGAKVFYSLRVRCALNFFSCVEDVVKSRAKQIKLVS